MELEQYQLVLVNLDPTIGGEMKKTRPCAIISPDEMNRHLQTIVIAPITSQLKAYPTLISIKQNRILGSIVLDQVRTIDRKHIVKVLGYLTEKDIAKIKSIIRETYVD
jgi:mRNA interferase MazF